jgi:hypothetical protein
MADLLNPAPGYRRCTGCGTHFLASAMDAIVPNSQACLGCFRADPNRFVPTGTAPAIGAALNKTAGSIGHG